MTETKNEMVIKQKYQIQIANLEATVKAINSVEITRDTLDVAQKELNTLAKIKTKIDDVRKELKEPYLLAGRDVDNVAKEFTKIITDALDPQLKKLQVVAKEVAEEQKKRQIEDERIANIKNGIANNILNFSQKISICENTNELINIERNINLEKGRKEKYAEFYDEFIEKLTPVYEQIKTQKNNFIKQELAQKEIDDAIAKNDLDALDKAEEVLLEAQQTTQQTSINIQEVALEQVTKVDDIITPQVIVPTISARRTTWEFEMQDQNELLKKAPQLALVELNKPLVKEQLNQLKSSGALDNKEEYISNGIRYYKKEIY